MSDEQNPGDGFPQDAPPPEGAPQEGYPQEGNPQEGYPQEGYPQEGYPQEGYPQEGYPQEAGAEQWPGQEAALQQSVPPPLQQSVPPPVQPSVPPAADPSVPPPPFGAGDDLPPPPGMEAAPGPPMDGSPFPAPAELGGYEVGDGGDAPEVMAEGEPAPAEEDKPKRKRKIDLKARLSSVRAAGTMAGTSSPEAAPGPAPVVGSQDGAAFPPPPTSGSVPPPRMLSSSGIAPPAALLGTVQPEPEESLPAAQAQTIKVEMGEEVMQERRKTRKRMALYGVLAAILTAVLGFFIGGTKARGDAQREAVAGAQGIVKDIEASAEVLSGLSDVLRESAEGLGQEKYPKDLADKLKETHVPFSADGLSPRKVSGLPGSVLKSILAYAGDVDLLNKRKDKLRNLLGFAKKPFEAYVAEKKAPKLRYSVVFSPGKKGMMAEFTPHTPKALFAEGEDWPEKYKVMRLQRGKGVETEVERWKKGELTGQTPKAIPVDQRTVAQFTSRAMIREMKKALADTKDLVDGRQSRIPSEQTDGLLKDGEQLIAELKKVIQKGK